MSSTSQQHSRPSPRRVRTGRSTSIEYSEVTAKEYRPINGHECTLPFAEDALSMYLNEGPCVLLERKIKQFFLISEKLNKTKLVFKSSLRIGMEKNRHLRYYYFTIHPFSQFRVHWEITMGIVFLLSIAYLPFFCLHAYLKAETMNLLDFTFTIYHILNFFCILDIGITCFTGYLDDKTETVVLNLKQIFKHYLCTFMIFDVIASFPLSTILLIFDINTEGDWHNTNRYFRFVRLFTSIQYLDNLMDVFRVVNHLRTLIYFVIFFLVFILYATYFVLLDMAWLVTILDIWDDIYSVFLQLSYSTLRTFFLMNPHHYGVMGDSHLILIYQFFLLQCGNIFNAFILARLLRIYNRTGMVLRKHEHLARQIKEYAKFKELPDNIVRALLKYIDFRFGRRIYDENLILNTLTPHMKDELFFLYSQKLVENVELFKDMPTSAIKRIAVRLKPEIVLPNDIIIQAGNEGSSMYFIIAGIVAVYTITGKEVCHLTDGANFGEIALLMNETRTASIVATDFCELFKLIRKDFQEAIEPFPELKERMIQIARERYTTILAFPDNQTASISE